MAEFTSSQMTEDNSHGDADQKDSVQEIRVLIDNTQVGGIIGKGGANVKRVRDGSGAFVSILKAEFRTVHERVMVLKGTSSQIAKATQLIADLLITASNKERNGLPQELSYTTSMRFLVHRSHVGAIIGKQGTVIKQTVQETGARVQVSNDPLPNSTEKSIQITGTPDAIEAAATRVLAQLQANPQRPAKNYPYVPGQHMMYPPTPFMSPYYPTPDMMHIMPPPTPQMQIPPTMYASHQKIAIPTVCAGCVIGKGGAVIRNLRMQSGTSISIADPETNHPSERIVTVYGNPAGIRKAVFLIRQLVEQYTPPAHHLQGNQGGGDLSNTPSHF